MNLVSLSASYLRARPLHTTLSLILLSLGVATIVLLLLVVGQLEERMQRDARGIDLVVGAKGSPMQLILSGIYHLDAPTGNVPLAAAQALAKERFVRKAMPLALGDSWKGYRIVGAGHDYPNHYGATLATGRLWEKPMEVVLGAEVAQRSGAGVRRRRVLEFRASEQTPRVARGGCWRGGDCGRRGAALRCVGKERRGRRAQGSAVYRRRDPQGDGFGSRSPRPHGHRERVARP